MSTPSDKGADMLLSTGAVAKRLGCSTDTVLRLMRLGELAAVRVGKRYKFRAGDVDAYLERGRVEPPQSHE